MSFHSRKASTGNPHSEEIEAVCRAISRKNYLFRYSLNGIVTITDEFTTEKAFLDAKRVRIDGIVEALSKIDPKNLNEPIGRQVIDLAYNARVWGDAPPYLYSENWEFTDKVVQTFATRAAASVIADLSGYCIYLARDKEQSPYSTYDLWPRDLTKRLRALMIARTVVESRGDGDPCIPQQVVRKISTLIEQPEDETGRVEKAAKYLRDLIAGRNLAFTPPRGRSQTPPKRPGRQAMASKGKQLVG